MVYPLLSIPGTCWLQQGSPRCPKVRFLMDFGSHLESPGEDLEFHFGEDSLIFGMCFSEIICISIFDRFLVDYKSGEVLDEAPAAAGSSTGRVRETIKYHYSSILSIIFVIYFRAFVLDQFLIDFGSILGAMLGPKMIKNGIKK